MNHWEQLVEEWLDYRGYIVKCNVCVGALAHGGHAGEIDVAAFHPHTKHCLHIECSGDAESWGERRERFKRKFHIGREFFGKEVLPWLQDPRIEQWALVWSAGRGRETLDGVKIVTARMLYRNIARDVMKLKGNRIVPEKYSLLRTVQITMRLVGDSKRALAEIAQEPLLLPAVV